MTRSRYFILLIVLPLASLTTSSAQETLPYRKTAISFNITRMLINEINMGIERFVSQTRSIEIDGGLVYANEFWQNATESYTSDPLFHEHGYALRVHYKMWKMKENTKWRNYMAPGMSFKHLYYNGYYVAQDKKDGKDRAFTEEYYENRERDKFGLEFIWGNVYEANRTFAFEIYYGAGLTVSSVKRTLYDHTITYQSANEQWRNQDLPNTIDHSVYLRPVIQAGFKLMMRL